MSHGPENTDYNETSDVTEVHAAVKREHSEPVADVTPIPVWVSLLCTGVLIWGAGYMGVFHGGFRGNVFNEYDSTPTVLFPVAKKEVVAGPAVDPIAALGKSTYSVCAACHQSNGLGQAPIFPPLAGSEWVIGGEKRVIAIVLKGLQGPLTVKGQAYNNAMPGQEALSDAKIAAVITFIRSQWGNAASAVTPEMVASVRDEFKSRTTPWTEADLLQIPADSKPAGAPAPVEAAAPAAGTPAPATTTSAPATASAFDLAASVERGKALYPMTCMSCHQPTGAGLPPVFPPLAKSAWVTENPRRLAAILLKGLQGPIDVNGMSYNNMMLAAEVQFPVLKDPAKLADVLNYVRNSWGNKSDEPVTPELVEATKKQFESKSTPWTSDELKAFPPAP